MRLGSATSFALAAGAALALTLNATAQASHPARFLTALLLLITFHILRFPRFTVSRELRLYLILAIYMSLSLLWTDDTSLALDTMKLVVGFILTLILFGALALYHDLGAVLAGMLVGFLVGAAVYSLTSHFPFSYPEDFSYNTIAGMYLFGLFIALIFGAYRRLTVVSILLGAVLMLHIMATTSIKTNLGVALGVAGAGMAYTGRFLSVLRRIAIPLMLLTALIVYGVVSNPALLERVQVGTTRVGAGVGILVAREDVQGVTEFGARQNWKDQGLAGWAANPVFGHGVEAFREDYGVTSHSTPVDLLYNAGVIGLALFYGIFASIGWRLYRARDPHARGVRAIVFAALVCYVFISLSGTIYYDPFVAAFVALGVAIAVRTGKEDDQSRLRFSAVRSLRSGSSDGGLSAARR
jgi:hypothetical protein